MLDYAIGYKQRFSGIRDILGFFVGTHRAKSKLRILECAVVQPQSVKNLSSVKIESFYSFYFTSVEKLVSLV